MSFPGLFSCFQKPAKRVSWSRIAALAVETFAVLKTAKVWGGLCGFENCKGLRRSPNF